VPTSKDLSSDDMEEDMDFIANDLPDELSYRAPPTNRLQPPEAPDANDWVLIA